MGIGHRTGQHLAQPLAQQLCQLCIRMRGLALMYTILHKGACIADLEVRPRCCHHHR